MSRSYFALIKDPYALDLSISIFWDVHQAERARKITGSPDSEVIRFLANDHLLELLEDLPIYLSATNEDEGLRIHAAFASFFGSQRFLMSYPGESTCRTLLAWPAPIPDSERNRKAPEEQPAIGIDLSQLPRSWKHLLDENRRSHDHTST